MITLDRVVRARSSSRKAVERLIGEGNFVTADSCARKRARATYPQVSSVHFACEQLTQPPAAIAGKLLRFRHRAAERSLSRNHKGGLDMLMKIGGLARAIAIILA